MSRFLICPKCHIERYIDDDIEECPDCNHKITQHDTSAGHKRKDSKDNIKQWWHNWFGDLNWQIQFFFYLALGIAGFYLIIKFFDKIRGF